MKQRIIKECNYAALFEDGNTIRFAIDPREPILPLEYPEICDVSLGTICHAGCSYCYTSAIKEGKNYENVVLKMEQVYGSMTENERPFQLAYGGEGEPTLHPEFYEIMEITYNLGIMPNYTTNGMHLSDRVLEATQRFCGGVAVSLHPHLHKTWRRAIKSLKQTGVKVCVHVIVGQYKSTNEFWALYDELQEEGIKYFVALPFQEVGRAKQGIYDHTKHIHTEFDLFFEEACRRKPSDLALGALFYDYLNLHPSIGKELGISLYEPEVLSGYRIMDDTYQVLRKSSYDLTPKFATKPTPPSYE